MPALAFRPTGLILCAQWSVSWLSASPLHFSQDDYRLVSCPLETGSLGWRLSAHVFSQQASEFFFDDTMNNTIRDFEYSSISNPFIAGSSPLPTKHGKAPIHRAVTTVIRVFVLKLCSPKIRRVPPVEISSNPLWTQRMPMLSELPSAIRDLRLKCADCEPSAVLSPSMASIHSTRNAMRSKHGSKMISCG